MRIFLKALSLVLSFCISHAALNPPNATEKQHLPKNFISNPGLEGSSKGYLAYADSAAATPVDGTGGTPTHITCERSTVAPLSGAATLLISNSGSTSAQGEGCSYAFTVDDADKNKVLTINYDYTVASGTYADDEVRVFVYDVSNSALIYPSANLVKNTAINVAAQPMEFPLNGGTSYRLIFHVAGTGTADWALKLDSIVVGPNPKNSGYPSSPVIAYTPTLGNDSGGISNHTATAQYERNGRHADVEFKITFSNSSATFSGLTISLPPGLVFDSTFAATDPMFYSRCSAHDAGSRVWDLVARPISTTVRISALINAGSGTPVGNAEVTNAVPFTFNNGDSINCAFRIPIVGWTKNTVMSQPGANTPVFGTINGGSGSGTAFDITGGSSTMSAGTYNSSTGEWTVPVTGRYSIKAQVIYPARTQSVGHQNQVLLYKNGSSVGALAVGYAETTSSTSMALSGSMDLDLVAGDVIKFRAEQSTTAGSLAAANFFISKYNNAQQIAATETVAFEANTSSTAASTTTPFIFSNVVSNTFNFYNPSNGNATVPANGWYNCAWSAYTGSTAANINLYVNGSNYAFGSESQNGGNVGNGSINKYFTAGTTLTVRPDTSATGSGVNTTERFSCIRVGI